MSNLEDQEYWEQKHEQEIENEVDDILYEHKDGVHIWIDKKPKNFEEYQKELEEKYCYCEDKDYYCPGDIHTMRCKNCGKLYPIITTKTNEKTSQPNESEQNGRL